MVQVNFTEAKYDAVLVSGDGWSQSFNVSGLSLAGATVTCTTRTENGGSTGVTVTPVVAGAVITITLTGANVTTLAPFRKVTYAIVVTPAAGQPRTLVGGYLIVVPTNSGTPPTVSGGTVGLSVLSSSGVTLTVTAWLYGQVATIICTSSTRPGSPTTGQYIFETDTLRTLFWNGTTWVITSEPIQTWTPTFTGLTVGNGTINTATYRRSGGLCTAIVRFTMGSTSAVTGWLTVTNLPVTLVGTAGESPGGVSVNTDVSAGQNYILNTIMAGANSMALVYPGAAGIMTFTAAAAPFVWNGPTFDIIVWSITYPC